MELRRIQEDSDPASAAEPVLLIIADISGYTRYMTANAKTLAHSQTIITELFKTIQKHKPDDSTHVAGYK